jgi:hypothetical protein
MAPGAPLGTGVSSLLSGSRHLVRPDGSKLSFTIKNRAACMDAAAILEIRRNPAVSRISCAAAAGAAQAMPDAKRHDAQNLCNMAVKGQRTENDGKPRVQTKRAPAKGRPFDGARVSVSARFHHAG